MGAKYSWFDPEVGRIHVKYWAKWWFLQDRGESGNMHVLGSYSDKDFSGFYSVSSLTRVTEDISDTDVSSVSSVGSDELSDFGCEEDVSLTQVLGLAKLSGQTIYPITWRKPQALTQVSLCRVLQKPQKLISSAPSLIVVSGNLFWSVMQGRYIQLKVILLVHCHSGVCDAYSIISIVLECVCSWCVITWLCGSTS